MAGQKSQRGVRHAHVPLPSEFNFSVSRPSLFVLSSLCWIFVFIFNFSLVIPFHLKKWKVTSSGMIKKS